MEKKALEHNARRKQEELDLSTTFFEAVRISSVQIPEIDMGASVRATVVQASTIYYDTAATIDKACRLVAQAASDGSQLVVFPEAFIGGYLHESTIGGPSTIGKAELDYHAAAIDVPGPEVDRIAAIARNYKVFLVMGVIERVEYTLYSTVLFFDPQGQHLGKHRKLMLTGLERMISSSMDGPNIPVYQTPIRKISALISWENRMPLLRTSLYNKDVEIYCAPTFDVTDVWQASMTHIALEGGCFVLSANQLCRREDYPPPPKYEVSALDQDFPPNSVVCIGGSMIISPSGVLLAGPNYEGEALITADLNLDEIVKTKLEFDVVGASGHLSSLLRRKASKNRRVHL